MKRIHILLIFFLTPFFLKAQKDLVILHTNDTHSHIEPYKNKFGGYEARYEAVKQERDKDGELLLLDAGDFMQGTSYFNLFKGKVEVKMMNKVGYDAVSLGNHEFDNGLEALYKRLKKATFPVLCANYHFKHKKLEKLIKPYIVVEKKGVKIGIFGLLTDLKGYNGFSDVLNAVQYLDPLETAQNIVKQLKEIEHCDFIICLSHVGYEQVELFQKVFDPDIANAAGGIDLIIGGHTHKLLEQPDVVNGVPILQNSDKGTMIGKMVIHFP
ncbi:MAG: metallophosphatase [Bacteroidales bacterium]|jgi:5'-nucleotidase|nr:metallophosphatase [Bacteroidales bacterium]